MKKLVIILAMMLMISGCSSKVRYNSQYGVRYINGDNTITIHLDEKNSDVIADMWITNSGVTAVLDTPSEKWNADMTKAEDCPVTYFVQQNEDGSFLESIVLRFYRDDFSFEDASALLKYIGLSDAVAGSSLKYRDGLLKAREFRFEDILKNGTFHNNISLNGDPKFDYKG